MQIACAHMKTATGMSDDFLLLVINRVIAFYGVVNFCDYPVIFIPAIHSVNNHRVTCISGNFIESFFNV